ncbi:unnamed protein product, partial [Closterium sp. NIES-65]
MYLLHWKIFLNFLLATHLFTSLYSFPLVFPAYHNSHHFFVSANHDSAACSSA